MTTIVNIIETCFFAVTDGETEKARMFVPCKPFKPGRGSKYLSRTSTLAYWVKQEEKVL